MTSRAAVNARVHETNRLTICRLLQVDEDCVSDRIEMEKTKVIPGWYQRLSNLQTKPVSQITFKQYCQENETRMKILYPFLPHDQIKGKLLTYWKRKQPPEHKTLERIGSAKHKKQLKYPVVHLFPRSSAKSNAQLQKTNLPAEWLNGAGSLKAGDKDGKTYKGRAFVLPTKVPEVISQPSNHERSILKNGGREGGSSAREKRQPASRVSFTSQYQQNLSPLLYSPPSPFVLSPLSDGDQLEKDLSPSKQKCFRQSPPKVTSKKVKQSQKLLNATKTRKDKQTEAKQSPRTLLPYQTKAKKSFSQKKEEKIQSPSQPVQSPRSSPSKRGKVRGKRRKLSKNSQRKEHLDNHPDSIHLSSECLELPVLPESPDPEGRRFCLFEDEWVKPKPAKSRAISHSTKSPKTRSKNKKSSFSWSPAVVYSQQTPRLKKSKHSLFSQDKAETYQRQKRPAVSKASQKEMKCKKLTNTADKGKLWELEAECQHSASLMHVPEVQRDSRRRKPPQTNRIKEKDNEKRSCASAANPIKYVKEIPINEENENKTMCITDASETHVKNVSFKQSNIQNMRGKCRFSHNRPKFGTSQSTEGKMSKCLQQNDEDSPISKTGQESLVQSDVDQKENASMLHKQTNNAPSPLGKINNILHKNPLKQKQILKQVNFSHSGEEATPEISPSKLSPSSKRRSQSDPDPKAIEEECNYIPQSMEGTSVLWRILLELKGTAASSQGQSNPPPSPAQSRVTEVSEMSVKSPSSYAPSPSLQDLTDDCGPTAAEVFPLKKTMTMMNTASSYRKRGNILCNMFDEPNPEIAVPAKVRRYISSETCPQESDFSMLFNADTFV